MRNKYFRSKDESSLEARFQEQQDQNTINTSQLADIAEYRLNLFDKSKAVLGKFVSGGMVYANASWGHSDYIPVIPGKYYTFLGTPASPGEQYDENKVLKSNIGILQQINGLTTLVASPGVYFIRFNIQISLIDVNNVMLIKGDTLPVAYPTEYIPYNDLKPFIKSQALSPSNYLSGKKIGAAGDSITQGINPGGGYFKNYAQIIAERNGMSAYNYGISGSTLSNVVGKNPFTGRWNNMDANLDYLLIWFGWNDQAYSSLGAITDTIDTTFYGAWNVILPQLITKYPKAKIGLIVPYLPAGKEAWQQAVRDIGIKWGLPVLDLMDKNTPLIWLRNDVDPTIAQLRRSTFTYDGTHPNQDGYNYMSTFIEDFIKSL